MDPADAVDSLRDSLRTRFLYLLLASNLTKRGVEPRLRKEQDELANFIEGSLPHELRSKGPHVAKLLDHAIAAHGKYLPRKRPFEIIASDFQALMKQQDVWRFGIEFGWLEDRYDLSGLPLPRDLPPHARIGLAHHAGLASVEELFLLEDTYLLLTRAEELHARMLRAAEDAKIEQASTDGEMERMLRRMNAEVGTLCRLTVVNSVAFVEAFVNSIGWAAALRHPTLSDQARTELKGTQRGRYLSLERKLERYPFLIRCDGSRPIVVSDKGQIREPFLSFLAETQEVRDASMHYAPGKLRILRPPGDWVSRARSAAEHGIAVAREFWSACYPARGYPDYLDDLEHARFLRRASAYVQEDSRSRALQRPSAAPGAPGAA